MTDLPLTRDQFWAAARFEHDQAGNLLLPPAMPRADYERECERVAIAALGDDEIAQRGRRGWYEGGYIMPHSYSQATLTAYLRSVLDAQRAWGILVERGAYTVEVTPSPTPGMVDRVVYRPVPQPAPRPLAPSQSCAACGAPTARINLLTSPRGEVCPDCYDEVAS